MARERHNRSQDVKMMKAESNYVHFGPGTKRVTKTLAVREARHNSRAIIENEMDAMEEEQEALCEEMDALFDYDHGLDHDYYHFDDMDYWEEE